MIHTQDADFTLYQGDVLEELAGLPAESVHCVVTSPPYWGLRDYGVADQLGLESTPDEYITRMVEVFREVRRVLRRDGTLWLNIGASYSSGDRDGHGTRIGAKQGTNRASAEGLDDVRPPTPPGFKAKDMVPIPWLLALALQADGWYLRADIIWAKPNPMPESVTDRPTKSHEYVFLLTRSPRYFFDQEAVREPHNDKAGGVERFGNTGKNGGYQGGPVSDDEFVRPDLPKAPGGRVYHPSGRNVRSVWEIATQPYPEAHFATYPEELVRRCILAGSPVGGTVLDPFLGSGTTAHVARKHGRRSIGIELNPAYCQLAARRLQQQSLFSETPT